MLKIERGVDIAAREHEFGKKSSNMFASLYVKKRGGASQVS
jgi:hypothetical protein